MYSRWNSSSPAKEIDLFQEWTKIVSFPPMDKVPFISIVNTPSLPISPPPSHPSPSLPIPPHLSPSLHIPASSWICEFLSKLYLFQFIISRISLKLFTRKCWEFVTNGFTDINSLHAVDSRFCSCCQIVCCWISASQFWLTSNL